MLRRSILLSAILFLWPQIGGAAPRIDRKALVTRHNPILHKLDVDAPLTVGNGGFAFGADITGLQTFSEHYHRWGIPVETLSRWAWHSEPNPNGCKLGDTIQDYRLPDGRILGFPTRQASPAGDWLRKNPHNHPLGQLALEWLKADGSVIVPEDIEDPQQTLDLWRGIIASRFKLAGTAVSVTTVCAPDTDTIGVRIESPLIAQGKLRVQLGFPLGHDLNVKNTPPLDWSKPEAHESKVVELRTIGGILIQRKIMERTLDAVLREWDWETKIWGWDYAMIAMTATRLGRPDLAVELLLRDSPNNRYYASGHCPQGSNEAMTNHSPTRAPKREIAAYLPANGAMLSAVALMVAGWDGCKDQHPGIPKDGTWTVRAEGLRPLP